MQRLLGKNNFELDKINIILVTTTKNTIKDHSSIVKAAGFKPGVFDADPIALINLHKTINEIPKQGSDVILNIGHTTTSLVVWSEEFGFFTREVELAGHEINKRLVQEQSLDYETANNNKNSTGIAVFDNSSDEENENEGAISIEKRTIFNDLIEEIRKTLRFYMKNNNQSYFNKFYLSGGCATIPGLKDFIETNLNVTVEELNPFNNFNCNISIDNPNQFSVAVGLALRGLEE